MEDPDLPLKERIALNLKPEFFEALESELRWGAEIAWRNVVEPIGIGSPPRREDDIRLELDALVRQRRLLGCKALIRSAERLNIPTDFRHVGGGHRVAFAQAGSLIVCLEPVRYFEEKIVAANYKIDLARGHQELLQLELPFTGEENNIDARGALFVVIQHLVPLTSLDRSDCMLSGIRLVVPDRTLRSAVIAESIIGDGYKRNFVWPSQWNQARPQEDRAQPKSLMHSRRKDGSGVG